MKSPDFEVLVGTKDCASMGEYHWDSKLMPTGLNEQGLDTYSCLASTASLASGQVDAVLGRLDQQKESCFYVWRNKVAQQGTGFKVLLAP